MSCLFACLVTLAVLSVAFQSVRALSPAEQAQLTLAKMTRREKLNMMHGVNGVYTGNIPGNTRLGIPAIKMQDGPQGFRVTSSDVGVPGTSTCWPSALSVAASWDESLMYSWASAMASEFKMKGANMQLGPGIGLARVPNAGRNFEYLSGEDPVLGAKLVVPVVKGIQDQGIMANAKHWVNNEIETHRQTVSANVGERVRFEIYYPPFQAAVDAGVVSVMCSYNRVNDISSCQNPETYQHLRQQLGFKGWVVSDWMATRSTQGSLDAGMDVEMPLGLFYSDLALENHYKAGNLTDSRIDESVKRLLTSIYSLNIKDDYGDPLVNATSVEHNQLTREIAAKSTVLLKNSGNILPLKASSLSGKCVAVIGDEQTYGGNGSGHVTPYYVITPQNGIRNALNDAGITDAEVVYYSGSDINEASTGAAKCEYAVVVVATNSGEGSDRESLSFDGNQDSLVEAIVAANPKTIVVASVPGAVLMPWSSKVPAILVDWLPGQEYGNAMADVLFGKVNPSGRLPVTMPNKENEVGFTPEMYPGVGKPLPEAAYSEELLVGYRWYFANNVTPNFPFGHGLSYTSFEYKDVSISKNNRDSNDFVDVTVTVSNKGPVAGNEVAQLYIAYPASAGEPPRQLRSFVKTAQLAPEESVAVKFSLSKRDLSIWDESAHQWSLVSGQFTVMVGASSEDIRVSQTFTV